MVATWRKDGACETDAPPTPVLDRVEAVAILGGVKRTEYLRVLQRYGKRCELAHHAPPQLEEHKRSEKDENGNQVAVIDWRSFLSAMQEKENHMRSGFSSGVWTNKREMSI